MTAAEQEFVLNGGQGTLDLRQLDVPAGQTVDTEVTVRAGQATVIVPKDATVNVTCTANAGEIDCLGRQRERPAAGDHRDAAGFVGPAEPST